MHRIETSAQHQVGTTQWSQLHPTGKESAVHQRLIRVLCCNRKSENPAWRLSFVVTNPPWHERLEEHDKVYVLRERGGAWMA